MTYVISAKLYYPTKISVCGFQRTTGRAGKIMGLTGFEPVTLRLSSACSNQLSYRPVNKSDNSELLVELRRVELLTYSLQSYRSTN